MTEIRTLIVDDEAPARARVRDLLTEERDISIIGECADGSTAIDTIRREQPALLFLDIRIPDENGFAVLKQLGDRAVPLVIFTTAYDQHAIEAFDVCAIDYLLKPLQTDRFRLAVERARERLRDLGAHPLASAGLQLSRPLGPEPGYLARFVVKTPQRVVIIKTSEVDWIETAGNYLILHRDDENHLIRESLRSLEQKLDPRQFQRISRSAIVNIDRIRELHPSAKAEHTLVLASGARLVMTRGLREWQRSIESVS